MKKTVFLIAMLIANMTFGQIPNIPPTPIYKLSVTSDTLFGVNDTIVISQMARVSGDTIFQGGDTLIYIQDATWQDVIDNQITEDGGFMFVKTGTAEFTENPASGVFNITPVKDKILQVGNNQLNITFDNDHEKLSIIDNRPNGANVGIEYSSDLSNYLEELSLIHRGFADGRYALTNDLNNYVPKIGVNIASPDSAFVKTTTSDYGTAAIVGLDEVTGNIGLDIDTITGSNIVFNGSISSIDTTNLYKISGGLYESTTSTHLITTVYEVVDDLEIYAHNNNLICTDSTVTIPVNGGGFYNGAFSMSFSYSGGIAEVEGGIFINDAEADGMEFVRSITNNSIGSVSIPFNGFKFSGGETIKLKLRTRSGSGTVTIESFQISVSRLN